jgi:hypothetical protein
MSEDERQLPSETEIAETKVSCQPDLSFFDRCSATILSLLHSSTRGMTVKESERMISDLFVNGMHHHHGP